MSELVSLSELEAAFAAVGKPPGHRAPALIAIAKAAMVHIDAHDNEVLSGDAFYKAVADTRQELRKALKAVRP